MKTEKEVKAELKEAKQLLDKVQKRFKLYDNHEDLDEIERFRALIAAYEWVLSK